MHSNHVIITKQRYVARRRLLSTGLRAEAGDGSLKETL